MTMRRRQFLETAAVAAATVVSTPRPSGHSGVAAASGPAASGSAASAAASGPSPASSEGVVLSREQLAARHAASESQRDIRGKHTPCCRQRSSRSAQTKRWSLARHAVV